MASLLICEGYASAEYAWISLNMPLKCLNMREDASITVNMIEYAAIPTKTTLFPSEKMRWGQGCLKKQSAEYAIILHKVTVQITEQLSRQTYSEHFSNI